MEFLINRVGLENSVKYNKYNSSRGAGINGGPFCSF